MVETSKLYEAIYSATNEQLSKRHFFIKHFFIHLVICQFRLIIDLHLNWTKMNV